MPCKEVLFISNNKKWGGGDLLGILGKIAIFAWYLDGKYVVSCW